MINTGLKDKVALITGGNNPFGIGAAIARSFAAQGVKVFIHYFKQSTKLSSDDRGDSELINPGFDFFMKQQAKSADEVVASIRDAGGIAESWGGDLRVSKNVHELFEEAEKVFGHIDILVNNAAEYTADTFVPQEIFGAKTEVWETAMSTVDEDNHDRNFAVNSRATAILMRKFAGRIIERQKQWDRIINISADCSWGAPLEISYRASKHAMESYSRSAAAELGPYGITVNIVSPGPVQSGYISQEAEEALTREIPLRRVGKPEDIASAVTFFASEQAAWITGQLLIVHGGHRMAMGQL